MYWTFLVAVACTFVLSLSADRLYRAQASTGRSRFHLEMGVVPFTVIVFVLGFFMALGKAAVYKHIPVYYPKNVGAVGGLVGMIGGLGGFVLPIAFGALNDLTGVWTSCFMLLFVLVSGRFALDARFNSSYGKCGRRYRRSGEASAASGDCRRFTSRRMSARCRARCSPTGGRRTRSSGTRQAAPSPAAICGCRSRRCCCHSRSGRSGRSLSPSCRRSGSGSRRINCSGSQRCPGISGRNAAHLLFLHGADLRRPAVDDGRNLVADDPGGRHRLCGAESEHAVFRLSRAGAAVRSGRRQLRLVDGQHLVLLPAR